MGNDQSLTATSETWHSHELGVNLLSIPTGPMIRKQNFHNNRIEHDRAGSLTFQGSSGIGDP
jgi:hypothetical protein